MQIQSYRTATDLWLAFQQHSLDYLLRRTGDADLAAEINQQVLQKVLDTCCSGREIANGRAWLLRIAHNALVDHYRRIARPLPERPDTDPTEADALYAELAAFLEPLLACLPDKYATPLRWADLEGLPQQAVADRLGLTLSAAKSRIQRGRQLLRTQIEKCFHLEAGEQGLRDFVLKDSCRNLGAEGPETCASDC
jgi:RNA polymerase sigma-70 factor, ECF subfamily